MPFQRLSILGVGLLGGSIGLALKKQASPCKIIGYGHREESLKAALSMGAIDEFTRDPKAAVQGADLVILCTPVGIFEPLLREIAGALQGGAIVTDVGSTKRSVCRVAEQTLPAGIHFVGSHPMAGSEKRGVDAASAELYRGALCITTPTPRSDLSAVRQVESFWQMLGMRVTRVTPEDHDRLLADVSHLPHALAAALVLTQSDQTLPLAGKGYQDTTRIAAGDPGLWRDIFLDNADNLRDSINRLKQHLNRLELMLEPSKAKELTQWLEQAASRRRSQQ
jgi:prephenate dehydrogenase